MSKIGWCGTIDTLKGLVGMRRAGAIVCAALVCVLCTGCQPVDTAGEMQTGTITAAGSSSAWHAAGVLLEAFTLDTPNATATFTNGGSMEGVLGVYYGALDISIASNAMDGLPEGLAAIPFGMDGIAIITHPDNPVDGLTTAQLRAVYGGEITNWAQLGGPDMDIQVMGHVEMNGARREMENVFGVPGVYTALFMGEGGILHEVANNPAAVGCVTLCSLEAGAKVLQVDGIVPSAATVAKGEYPFLIRYHIVYNTARGQEENIRAFLGFCTQEHLELLAAASGLQPMGDI